MAIEKYKFNEDLLKCYPSLCIISFLNAYIAFYTICIKYSKFALLFTGIKQIMIPR